MSAPKLTPTQLRVLRYASEGRLVMYWSSQGPDSYYVRGGDGSEMVRSNTVDALFRRKLVGFVRDPEGSPLNRKVVVTPKGAALLEEEGA